LKSEECTEFVSFQQLIWQIGNMAGNNSFSNYLCKSAEQQRSRTERTFYGNMFYSFDPLKIVILIYET